MPVFDDWESAALVCSAIDQQLRSIPEIAAHILLIDDGSRNPIGSAFAALHLESVTGVSLLKLRRNLGHQRAIAIGLAYVHANLHCDAVLVMDADGEDRPEDIPRLIGTLQSSKTPVIVFAERGRRVESALFKVLYLCYRFLHYAVTGKGIKVGNFSLIPAECLNSVVSFPELWNHYAAAVLKSRIPHTMIRADRGYRLAGESKMNFVSLVIHGLSALFAYHEIVATRMLIGTVLLTVSLFLLVAVMIVFRLTTSFAVPGWTTIVSGFSSVLIFQSFAAALIIVFSVMMNRSSLGFLPLRDYTYFISSCEPIDSIHTDAALPGGVEHQRVRA